MSAQDRTAAPARLSEWFDSFVGSEEDRAIADALEAVVWTARDVVSGLPAVSNLRQKPKKLDEEVEANG